MSSLRLTAHFTPPLLDDQLLDTVIDIHRECLHALESVHSRQLSSFIDFRQMIEGHMDLLEQMLVSVTNEGCLEFWQFTKTNIQQKQQIAETSCVDTRHVLLFLCQLSGSYMLAENCIVQRPNLLLFLCQTLQSRDQS